MSDRRLTDRRRSERGSNEPRFLIIGYIRKPHGIYGEVKVTVETDVPERFTWLETVYISTSPRASQPEPIDIETIRTHGDDLLLRFAGHASREAAEHLRKHWIFVPIEQALPLEEGEYYSFQVVGVSVTTESGVALGTVESLLETGANDVYIVQGPYGELLIPDTDEVVQSLDIEAKTLIVRPIPGLLPDFDAEP